MRKFSGIFALALLLGVGTGISAYAGTTVNNESIGSHTISFGAGYGYGSAPMANFFSGYIDINLNHFEGMPQGSYFRTRLSLDVDDITTNITGSLGASFQYMQPIAQKLYVYPFLGVKFEHHTNPAWAKANDFSPIGGAGIEYQFTKNIGAFVQGAYEYAIPSLKGTAMAQAGVVFAFGPGRSSAVRAAKANTAKLAKAAKADAQRAKAAKSKPFAANFDGGAAPVTTPEKTSEGTATEPVTAPATEPAEVPAKTTVAEPVATPVTEPAAKPAEVPVIEALPVNGIRINKGTTVSVPFVSGSYEVGNSARTKILTMVPYLMTHPEAKVELAAYGDKHAEKQDATLASKREKAVRDILTGAGISSDRIVAPEKTAVQAVTTQPGSVAIVTIK